MAGKEVTDPALLQQLEGPPAFVPTEVTDPAILRELGMPPAEASPVYQTGFVPGMAKGAQALVRGANSILGLPGDMQKILYEALPQGAQQALDRWNPNGTTPQQNQLPTSASMNALTDRLGLTGNPAQLVNPADTAERYIGAAGAGAVAALPAAATGGVSAIPAVMAQGAGGGVGSELAGDIFPNADEKYKPAIRMVGGLLGGGAVGGVQAWRAGPVVDNIANALGRSRTIQDAGHELQDQAHLWNEFTKPMMLDEELAPFTRITPDTTGIPMTGVVQRLREQSFSPVTATAAMPGTITPAIRELAPGLSQRLLDGLTRRSAMSLGFTPTLAEVMTFKRFLGDAMSNRKLVEDIGQKNLVSLYEATSSDIRNGLAAHGMHASVDAFNRWNNAATEIYQTAAGPMSRVINSPNAVSNTLHPEDVAKRLLGGSKNGDSDLSVLRREIPGAVDELASAALREQQAGRLPIKWAGLSPEAKATLVQDPEHRATLDRELPARPIPSLSRTLQHGAGLGVFSGSASIVAHSILGADPGLLAQSLTPGATGAFLGMGIPMAVNLARRAIANPLVLRGPLSGALGGSASGQLGGNSLVVPGSPGTTGQPTDQPM